MMRWSPASRSQLDGRRNLPITPGAAGDPLTLEGLDKLHYSIANRRIAARTYLPHAHSLLAIKWLFVQHTFFTESFIDECATVGGEDPLDYRRALLRDNPRHLAVLKKVAELSGWGSPLAAGRGAGSQSRSAIELSSHRLPRSR